MLHLAPFDMTSPQQEALQNFIESGNGWVGIHAAGLAGKQLVGSNNTYWQWFEEFLGGVTYSPQPAYQKGTVLVEDRRQFLVFCDDELRRLLGDVRVGGEHDRDRFADEVHLVDRQDRLIVECRPVIG